MRSPPRSSAKPRSAASPSSWSATAHAVCSTWNRSSKSTRRLAASATRTSMQATVASLFDAGFVDGLVHARRVGLVEEIPYLKRQQRLTFARIGITDPLSIDDYVAHGGIEGLKAALTIERRCRLRSADRIRPARPRRRRVPRRHQVAHGARRESRSEIHRLQRGRRRFRHVLRPPGNGKRSVRADRRNDHRGHRHGRDAGHIYVRSEYPHSIATLEAAIAQARARAGSATACSARRTGSNCSSRRARAPTSAARKPRCSNRSKANAASCARSRRCRRSRACSAKPTVINNVITLATVPIIFARGAAFYKNFGMGRSRGTLPFRSPAM